MVFLFGISTQHLDYKCKQSSIPIWVYNDMIHTHPCILSLFNLNSYVCIIYKLYRFSLFTSILMILIDYLLNSLFYTLLKHFILETISKCSFIYIKT